MTRAQALLSRRQPCEATLVRFWIVVIGGLISLISCAVFLPPPLAQMVLTNTVKDWMGRANPTLVNVFTTVALALIPLCLIIREILVIRRRVTVTGAALPFIRALALSVVFVCTAQCVKVLPASPENMLKTAAEDNAIPGMVAVATRGDGMIELVAVGRRHSRYTAAVLPTDRFHLGSNTKAMTATMLGSLVEQGKLAWNTRLIEMFPEWKEGIHPDYRDVTLDDLLLCRAGVPEYSNFSYLFNGDRLIRDDGSNHAEEDLRDWKEMTSLTGTSAEQRRDFARQVLHRKPAVPPKTTFLYSNASYGIAGAMAERATGQSWESLMRTHLFEPLGIQATFDWPGADDDKQPWGHFPADPGVRPHDPHGEYHLPACLLPAGGVTMSLGEYAKFLQLHLRGLAGRDGVLKSATIRYLHSRGTHGRSNSEPFFCYGWGICDFEGAEASLIEGSAGTFYASASLWPSRDLAVAVVANVGVKRAGVPGIKFLRWATHHYGGRTSEERSGAPY